VAPQTFDSINVDLPYVALRFFPHFTHYISLFLQHSRQNQANIIAMEWLFSGILARSVANRK
jgi:hypothetical protein